MDNIEIRKTEEKQLRCRIVCPFCLGKKITFGSPSVRQSSGKSGELWAGNGDLIDIPLVGECGHKFVLRVGSHSQSVYVFFGQP